MGDFMADTSQNNQNQNNQNNQQPQKETLARGFLGLFSVVTPPKKIAYAGLDGEITVVSKGLFFKFPWFIKPIEIVVGDGMKAKIDTPKRTSITRAARGTAVGPEVEYDTDYRYKVVDAEKLARFIYGQRDGITDERGLKEIVGDKIDQAVSDYIRTTDYNTLLSKSTSVDYLARLVGRRGGSGTFDPSSLNAEFLDKYGIEVTDVYLSIRPPQALVDAAKQQKQTELERERRKVEAEGQAAVMDIQSQAEAKKIQTLGAAQVSVDKQSLEAAVTSGVTPDVAYGEREKTRRAGSYKNATVFEGVGGMAPMMGYPMFGGYQPGSYQAGSGQSTTILSPLLSKTPQEQEEYYRNLSDDEYLSVEDSAALAAERGVVPKLSGYRFSIRQLTEDEKKRYHAASAKPKGPTK